MTWFPQCATTAEEDGPNFEPPILGPAFSRGQKRLREAQAFSKVQREASEFHERKARKYGVDHPVGMAHFKAARAYRTTEAAGRLQEMFDQNQSQIPPKAIHKAHKAAVGFHKKAAQKAGLDSPEGQAHVAALQHHLGIVNNAKQQMKASVAGHSGKQSPVPVPKKSEQPNEDIRQNLPPQPLEQLQKQKREAINRFGETRGPDAGGKRMNPHSDREIMKPDLVFRGKKPRPGSYGPHASSAPPVDAANQRRDREARRSLRRGI